MFIGLQNMLHQELKNQICNDFKAKYIRKFFLPSEIDVVKCHLTYNSILVLCTKPSFFFFFILLFLSVFFLYHVLCCVIDILLYILLLCRELNVY